MPDASNVYRKLVEVGVRPQPVSYVFSQLISYKHINPLGFKKAIQIKLKPDSIR